MKSIGEILNDRPKKPFNIEDFGGLNENEYLDGEMIYCKNCGGKKLFDFFGRPIRCMCKCDEQKRAEEEEKERKLKKLARIERLKKESLMGERYKNASFETAQTGRNETFDIAFNRCKKYCEVYSQALKNGYGIYIYGDRGTGKTFLTACMVNELTKNFQTALMTSFIEISKEIKRTYSRTSLEDEASIIDRLNSVDFLFLDDVGTEILTKNGNDTWINEKIYDVINKRYNANKPTIFTSNYSLAELVKNRGMMDKTVDRIMEMSSVVMKIEGDSYRKKNRNASLPF